MRSDWFGTALACVVALLAGATIAAAINGVIAGQSAEDQCLEAGRGWAIVGHHRAYRPVPAGKVTVMQPYTATDYGCVEVRR